MHQESAQRYSALDVQFCTVRRSFSSRNPFYGAWEIADFLPGSQNKLWNSTIFNFFVNELASDVFHAKVVVMLPI